MTNRPPQKPQNPIPERRTRHVTGVTFDEMVAMIVAFSTIGAILFWSIGGKNNKLASNFGLGSGDNSLASDKTNNNGFGFNHILSGDSDNTNTADLDNQDLVAENRRLAAQLREQESSAAVAPLSSAKSNQPKAQAQKKSLEKSSKLDSKAKLLPLAGVASLPAIVGKGNNNQVTEDPNSATEAPQAIKGEDGGVKTKPEATTPDKGKTEPTAVVPEKTALPKDIVPDYWAYPFVKQMKDKELVGNIAKNKNFEPDALITRAAMATLISQAFEQQPATKSAKKFKDVKNKDAIKDIDKAVSTGFMQGYSKDEFRPLENIPRYQVLVTLATGLGLKPSKDADQILQQFGDSSKMPDWAKQQVAAATEAGLVVNPPDTKQASLLPERSATRAEVAAMIHQALVKTGKLEPLESEYIVKP